MIICVTHEESARLIYFNDGYVVNESGQREKNGLLRAPIISDAPVSAETADALDIKDCNNQVTLT